MLEKKLCGLQEIKRNKDKEVIYCNYEGIAECLNVSNIVIRVYDSQEQKHKQYRLCKLEESK